MALSLQDLLLRKQELPIRRETSFIIPIHPILLRKDIALDPQIAHRVFPQAAREYFAELRAHTETVEDEQTKSWYNDFFLRESEVRVDNGRQVILCWEDLVLTTETGFAHCLSISRDAGGILFFNKEDRDCVRNYIYPPLVDFTPEKFEAYAVERIQKVSGVVANTYASHNIDYFPGALFLRNWALLYHNAALQSIAHLLPQEK